MNCWQGNGRDTSMDQDASTRCSEVTPPILPAVDVRPSKSASSISNPPGYVVVHGQVQKVVLCWDYVNG